MFAECLTLDTLPASFGRSRIILLYRKGDRSQLANWRPISLMNTDEKILTKILTSRLQMHLPSIISPAQTGFVRNRSIFDNIWSLEHALEAGLLHNHTDFLAFLDQEKVYNRMDHEYLFEILTATGFHGPWLKWVKLFYSNLSAVVTVNGFLSCPFKLTQGLRQGDPLSPLLYNLAFEPLLLSRFNVGNT